MKDINQFHFSGTVETFKRIQTRTGTPMATMTVMCWRERIKVVLFKDLATNTELSAGDRVECRGHIQSTEWHDKDGNRRSGWQVIATEISKADDTLQEAPAQQQQQETQPPAEQRAGTGSRFAYRGGPF